MAVAMDTSFRARAHHLAPHHSSTSGTLQDKYEIVKEIGDGSFGSVVLGRTRSAAAGAVRRNTMVAIKTMKKSFDSFAQCLELREVIFLKTLPAHQHLVPAYDIFLDPLSRKLHIAMEYMDGNLYQLMKSREHKSMDESSVKSILFQILSGLEHIHEHDFFHRDIKPENILVTSSATDPMSGLKRYSSIMTPPSTPTTYSIKLADFGLARETHSTTPYTTYVSTRWYRAPEVLLRAGVYSAPVDIWALGAMAVEIATLKPLFPGANEVDQVWRVCEIMGSPGLWVNKHGARVGGGEWKEGIKLASKLGFSFPKMAPHSLQSILPTSQWSQGLSDFVTWCLMWDPSVRPTSTQALAHPYFVDALDPLRPKSSSTSRLLGRSRHSNLQECPDSPHSLSSKTSSWFRRSLGPREYGVSPSLEQTDKVAQVPPRLPAMQTVDPIALPAQISFKPKQTISVAKRGELLESTASINHAPMPILPSIRPISPLHDSTSAQATPASISTQERPSKKLGRQLSVNSTNNHYADYHRNETEKMLSGGSGMASPTTSSREGFFAHLRKRARRISGKHHIPSSPPADDTEYFGTNGNTTAPYDRSSMALDPTSDDYDPLSPSKDSAYAEIDKVLKNVEYSLESSQKSLPDLPQKTPQRSASHNSLRHHNSVGKNVDLTADTPAQPRNRKSIRYALRQDRRYETPDEEDELLNEALASADEVSRRLELHNARAQDHKSQVLPSTTVSPGARANPYLTPSPSKENNTIAITQLSLPTQPVEIKQAPHRGVNHLSAQWPTPPYEDSEWAASAAASIFAAAAATRY